MKLQSLAIIFIIIIMPISMVLSEYINNNIKTEERELSYNTKLLNSTYDAIKAYQLNTVNNAFGDVTNRKIQDIEAAAKTFYNSLASNFNFLGNKSDVMKEYVPAIVFTMYDGYYTYTPFTNTLTEIPDKDAEGEDAYDKSYSVNGETEEGLKPYVYYTCRYKYNNGGKENDFSIIYTLDNYITIQGIVNNEYVYDNGYLYSIVNNESDADAGKGIFKKSVGDKEAYNYMGVVFTEDDTEELKEYVGGNTDDCLYSYAKINGKKYYLDENYYTGRPEGETEVDGIRIKNRAGIFFIDSNGTRNYNQVKGYSTTENTRSENTEFVKYYKAIKKNKSAYEYYKDAYEFSCWVLGKGETSTTKRKDKSGTEQSKYNLGALKAENSKIYQDEVEAAATGGEKNKNTTSLLDYGNIDIFGGDSNIENADSNFNQHRKAIIRYVVETNLSTAIKAFSSDREFLMPKISETDWETIENDVCAISFMQGMSLGAKKYNGYSVVANTLTKEYIDENDIYLLAKNSSNQDVYCKVNDELLVEPESEPELQLRQKNNNNTYYAGVWKVDFEQRQIVENTEEDGNTTEKTVHYFPKKEFGTYTSIMGSYDRSSIADKDMYKYVNSLSDTNIKMTYLMALGRERWGSYNVNNINYELYGNTNGNIYFLEDY